MANTRWRLGVVACVCVLAGLGTFSAVAQSAGGIVGGEPSATERWPWMTAIIVDDHLVCGGALVSGSSVITAEHCFADDPGTVEVQVGSVRLGEGQRVRVVEIHRHATADLAVLQLETPVESGAGVSPIALARVGNYGEGDIGWVSGWGSTEPMGEHIVASLRDVSVPLVSDAACERMFAAQFDAPTEVCAGGAGAGNCLGDSGGPLVVEAGGSWVLVGVVSRSTIPCASVGSPTIFTEVAAFDEWLSQSGGGASSAAEPPAEPPVEAAVSAGNEVVTTGYTQAEFATLTHAAGTLGLAPGELQKAGVHVLRFLTVLSGATDRQPLDEPPDIGGVVQVDTVWSSGERGLLDWGADHYGASPAEVQKVGVTLLSFLASLRT